MFIVLFQVEVSYLDKINKSYSYVPNAGYGFSGVSVNLNALKYFSY